MTEEKPNDSPESPSTSEATAAPAPAEDHGSHGEHHPGVGHVVPVWLLVSVLLALLFLTIVTVLVARVDMDFLNIWVAIGIATAKATLVCAFFMHLRWDKPFNTIVFVSALAFLAIFLSFSMMDQREYRPYLDNEFTVDGETMKQYLDEKPKPEGS